MSNSYDDDYEQMDDGREDIKNAASKGKEAYDKYTKAQQGQQTVNAASTTGTSTSSSTAASAVTAEAATGGAGSKAAVNAAVNAAEDAADFISESSNKLTDKLGNGSNNPSTEAKEFNRQLQQKEMTRPMTEAGKETAKKAGEQAATNTATSGAVTGGAATGGATAGGATAGGAAAGGAAAGGATAGGAAAGGAAAGGAVAGGAAAGGAVAAQAAVPVAGWIALAIEAAILLVIGLKKAINKRDKKNAENGVDTKSMRRLMLSAPILMPILIFFLVIVIIATIMQAETAQRVEVMQKALVCFENNGEAEGCKDFMNTGVWLGKYGINYNVLNAISKDIKLLNNYAMPYTGEKMPLIKKNDWHIARFVIDYILVENRIFSNNGPDFSLKGALETISDPEELLDDKSFLEEILGWIDSLIEDSIIGDIREFSYLFKWMKMEKKIFNQITWQQYTINRTGIGPLQDKYNKGRIYVGSLFGWKTPGELLSKEATVDVQQFYELTGLDLDILSGSGYLKMPRGEKFVTDLELDDAIALTREYIPSFIEVYATYSASGEYAIADKVYDYYVDNMKKGKELELILTTYELYSIDAIEKYGENEVTTYQMKQGDGSWEDIEKETYDELQKQIDNQNFDSFWSFLKSVVKSVIDAIAKFLKEVDDLISELKEKVRGLLGWNIELTSKYVTVVEKGPAYEYKMLSKYEFGVDEYEAEQEVTKSESKSTTSSKYDLEYTYTTCKDKCVKEGCLNYGTICDENGKCEEQCLNEGCIQTEKECTESTSSKGKLQLRVNAEIEYKQKHVIAEHSLRMKSSESSITEYEEGNRYNYVITQIEKEQKAKNSKKYVSATDAALAIDVIAAYYSNKFGLIGGATASDFVMAGTLNESVVSYAEQFKDKRLAYMRKIDDENIFFDGHWCAMFVSFCMKKAEVNVPVFYRCSQFWTKNKNKPGFFDVAGANNGGFITTDNSHVANISYVQPGDILLFRWADATTARSHTGICKSVEKDVNGNVTKITVIEGNSGSTNYATSKVEINEYTGSSIKSIVSFVSISTVNAKGGW